LLEKYRGYLQLVAEQQIDPPLRAKVGGSDLVQETFAEAHRDFPQFRGVTAEEFHAWLLQILSRNLDDVRRRFGRQKRDVSREVPHADGRSLASQLPASPGMSPSSLVRQRERDAELEAAFEKLSDRHREVIELRHRMDLAFGEVGERLGISEEAAKKRWSRAIANLQSRLEANRGK
jgi:RNA polymerase sigma-70 factor (ECF subfamily)